MAGALESGGGRLRDGDCDRRAARANDGRGKSRTGDPGRDPPRDPGRRQGLPPGLGAQRRRLSSGQREAHRPRGLARSGRRLLGGVHGHLGRRRGDPDHLGDRRRPRPHERHRRHRLPPQHRPRRRPQPRADPTHRRGDGGRDRGHRPRLGLRASGCRGPRRPLGADVRELLRGSRDRARLCGRDGQGPAGGCRRAGFPRRKARDRHCQAFPRRRRHRARQGPGRQPLERDRAARHPRRRVLLGDRSRGADRDGLVLELAGPQDPRQLRAPDRCPQGTHGLRRFCGRRLERPRPGRWLLERQLCCGVQRRRRSLHGSRRLEGAVGKHPRPGELGRDLDGAPRRRGAPHPPSQDAGRFVRARQALGPPVGRGSRALRLARAPRAGPRGGARVAGAAQEQRRAVAAAAGSEGAGGGGRRRRHRQAVRRLDHLLAGQRQRKRRLSGGDLDLGRHPRGGGERWWRRGPERGRRLREKTRRGDRGLRRGPLRGVPGRSRHPRVRLLAAGRCEAVEKTADGRHPGGVDLPLWAAAVGQPRAQRIGCLRRRLAAGIGGCGGGGCDLPRGRRFDRP